MDQVQKLNGGRFGGAPRELVKKALVLESTELRLTWRTKDAAKLVSELAGFRVLCLTVWR